MIHTAASSGVDIFTKANGYGVLSDTSVTVCTCPLVVKTFVIIELVTSFGRLDTNSLLGLTGGVVSSGTASTTRVTSCLAPIQVPYNTLAAYLASAFVQNLRARR